MRIRSYLGCMPKTIQIRDLDDDVYAGLVRRAAEAGVTVPELLMTQAARIRRAALGGDLARADPPTNG